VDGARMRATNERTRRDGADGLAEGRHDLPNGSSSHHRPRIRNPARTPVRVPPHLQGILSPRCSGAAVARRTLRREGTVR